MIALHCQSQNVKIFCLIAFQRKAPFFGYFPPLYDEIGKSFAKGISHCTG